MRISLPSKSTSKSQSHLLSPKRQNHKSTNTEIEKKEIYFNTCIKYWIYIGVFDLCIGIPLTLFLFFLHQAHTKYPTWQSKYDAPNLVLIVILRFLLLSKDLLNYVVYNHVDWKVLNIVSMMASNATGVVDIFILIHTDE